MKVLITVRENEQIIDTCDENCYDSTQPTCACVCAGLCHGIGRDNAQTRIQGNSPRLLENIRRVHPDATDVRVTFLRTIELSAHYTRTPAGYHRHPDDDAPRNPELPPEHGPRYGPNSA